MTPLSSRSCVHVHGRTGAVVQCACPAHFYNQILRVWKRKQLCLGDVKLENFVVRDKRREPTDVSAAALEVFVIDLAGVNEVWACCC